MNKIPFLDLFDVHKETDNSKTPNLTEEFIYRLSEVFFKNSSSKRVPVFSGATLNDGIIGYIPNLAGSNFLNPKTRKRNFGQVNFFTNDKDGCITIVADGRAGVMFFRNHKDYPMFAMNISSLALFKKSNLFITKKFPSFNGLLLEWFYVKFFDYFQSLTRSSGVSHFTKEIYSNVELEIPDIKQQQEEFKLYKYIFTKRTELEKLKDSLIELKDHQIYSDSKIGKDSFFNIFEFKKGTHGFTEYAIYHSLPDFKANGVPFWGGDLDHTIPKRFVSTKARNIDGELVQYFSEKECVILTVDGASAGSMTYKKDIFFTINHHAGVLTLRDKYKDMISLELFAYKYEKILKSLTVSTGSKTLSNSMLESLEVEFYKDYKAQISELEYLRKITEAEKRIDLIIKETSSLLMKNLII